MGWGLPDIDKPRERRGHSLQASVESNEYEPVLGAAGLHLYESSAHEFAIASFTSVGKSL